jgi:hypothetical protein
VKKLIRVQNYTVRSGLLSSPRSQRAREVGWEAELRGQREPFARKTPAAITISSFRMPEPLPRENQEAVPVSRERDPIEMDPRTSYAAGNIGIWALRIHRRGGGAPLYRDIWQGVECTIFTRDYLCRQYRA